MKRKMFRAYLDQGFSLYVCIADLEDYTLSRATEVLCQHLKRLLGQEWYGNPIVIAAINTQMVPSLIPHLRYGAQCQEGCNHPEPELGRKAFRFFVHLVTRGESAEDFEDTSKWIELVSDGQSCWLQVIDRITGEVS